MKPESVERPQNDANPNSLDFYVEARSGNKRNYIYDFREANNCTHPDLREMITGGNWYRCVKCNYAFFIQGVTMWPLHWLVTDGIFKALHFAKEFGADALGEVLRRPGGQADGSPHKPVLPEGMSLQDTLQLLEGVNVNSEDGGAAELNQLLEDVWVGPKERALQDKKEEELRLKENKQEALSDASTTDREDDP
jgi:hypothetical protein